MHHVSDGCQGTAIFSISNEISHVANKVLSGTEPGDLYF